MRSKTPPRLATILLTLFAPNEPLAGDIHEEYLAGRSAFWYWRQVGAAIVFGPWRRFDLHDLFAPQGMFMQIVMLALVSVSVVFTVKLLAVVVLDDAMMRTLFGPSGARELVRVAASFALAIPVGFAIARVHVHSRRTAVLAFSIAMPVWAFLNLYLLNGERNLDAAFPHVLALLMFITGLLSGGLYVDPLLRVPRART